MITKTQKHYNYLVKLLQMRAEYWRNAHDLAHDKTSVSS